jgi:hypothetical protein
MISALIVHLRPEPALALGLSRLVEGAVAGLLADVTILDLGEDALAARLAEEGGCALTRPQAKGPQAARGAFDAALEMGRAEWILVLPSRLVPARGWPEAVRETLSLAQAGAPIAGAALLTAPRGLLRRREMAALTRRALLTPGAVDPANAARAARAAAARVGRVRRLPGLLEDER